MRIENRPKNRLLCCQIAKILAPLWVIAVAEHDGIQTRYKFIGWRHSMRRRSIGVASFFRVQAACLENVGD